MRGVFWRGFPSQGSRAVELAARMAAARAVEADAARARRLQVDRVRADARAAARLEGRRSR